MGKLTTHVLDVAAGLPAVAMRVELRGLDATLLATASTNAEGRSPGPLLQDMTPGRYTFHVAAYFRARGVPLTEPPFQDEVVVAFGLADPAASYYVPLLVTHWSHSTYRGFASPPICNSGNLYGNIANGSRIGDSMPALIALGAEIELRCGTRTRHLPLERFYLGSRLAREGLAPARTAQLTCPIGLTSLPSKLPAAIAVGVAVQLLSSLTNSANEPLEPPQEMREACASSSCAACAAVSSLRP